MYRVKIYTGDYIDRQRQANLDNADLYLEQHLNSSVSESPDYGLGVIAKNGSNTSEDIARWYAEQAGELFDVGGPTDHDVGYGTGVRRGGRGNHNLSYTAMPAVILEPWFASNPGQAARYNTERGIAMAADLIVNLASTWVKPGGLIALSAGHVGKESNPSDRGAAIFHVDGGLYSTEGDWANAVVHRAAMMFQSGQAAEEVDPRAPITLRIHEEGGEEDHRIQLERGVKYTLTIS